MKTSESALPLPLQELVSIDELKFQRQILMPLLSALGFKNVRENSGPGERGKDVVATKDDLGGSTLYAFQVKRIKLNAKAGSPVGLGRHLDQLGQTIEEPVIDPATNRFRSPDRCVLVTPYPVSVSARAAFSERLQAAGRRGVAILDGTTVLDLVRQHDPSLLDQLSDGSRYRLRLVQEIGRVHETAAALALPGHLTLDSIYVEATATVGALVEPGGKDRSAFRPKLTIAVSRADFESLCDLYRSWSSTLPGMESERVSSELQASKRSIVRAVKKDLDAAENSVRHLQAKLTKAETDYGSGPSAALLKAISELKISLKDRRDSVQKLSERPDHEATADLDLRLWLEPLIERLSQNAESVTSLTRPDHRSDWTGIAAKRVALRRELQSLRERSVLRDLWLQILKTLPSTVFEAVSIGTSALARVQTNLFVIGKPGAGKTTLLRQLCRRIAESRPDRFPVFVPLVDLEPTEEAIVERSLSLVRRRGLSLSDQQFRAWLHNGELVLCLDGLDEAGAKAVPMLRAVSALSEHHQRCQIIVSCRDTFGIKTWDPALAVSLEPLNDSQIRQFIQNWPHFSSEVQPETLISWLARSESMRAAAATPLICALLCSLMGAGADLPHTEVELYDGRLELLLGRWDQAKGIPTLARAHRRRYQHFLAQLAFRMHEGETRQMARDAVLAVADDYVVEGVHRGALELLEDCVRRGVLECDDSGRMSFGHLTYQEHLAGMWLAERNDAAFVWERLVDPWWSKTLEFYAARKGDIRELFQVAKMKKSDFARGDRLRTLVQSAKDTPKSFVKFLT